MLQSEFDRLTSRPYTEAEFSEIHYVYCYHPAVRSKKDIADLRGYQLVLDRASDSGIIFGSPRIDISDEVLSKLGYK